ncbi:MULTISPECIES: DUF6597 domain-containing transcriptional factor [unclassified Pseudonocardia]|uniref:DUF6597 domain-containing transcriptional factor n=1 Tax=unclassified Pseudonocardia TaxID=2619320 RepID=UPI0007619D01|nr:MULTISPECIES: DUF6597 domain-containing transcriptional factor [unclassified Pseudonocardia]
MDADPRGLSGEWARYQRHHSEPPPPDLAGFVDRFWTVGWDYARPFLQKIVPYPQVHLTGEPGVGPLRISGPASRFVTRELHGRGRVVGVAFRPGTARALAGVPVATLADRRVPAGAPFDGPGPPDVDGLAERLRAVLPPDGPDRSARDAHDLVAAVVADRELTRVDRLARHGGYSVRSLQRIFHEHVGLGPKWVIRRYRLHEVTELMAGGAPVHWAEVAATLGYTDQAHLSRDFAGLFGEPPTVYARRYGPRVPAGPVPPSGGSGPVLPS